MAAVRQHQEAVWAVVAQGRVVVRVGRNDYNGEERIYPMRCWLYLPDRFRSWWDQNNQDCMQTIAAAIETAWGRDASAFDGDQPTFVVNWIMAIPAELADFVSQNTDHPKPRRYNSTAVTYYERDNVAWLTAPQAKLYDA